jgi:hypothetical protein
MRWTSVHGKDGAQVPVMCVRETGVIAWSKERDHDGE